HHVVNLTPKLTVRNLCTHNATERIEITASTPELAIQPNLWQRFGEPIWCCNDIALPRQQLRTCPNSPHPIVLLAHQILADIASAALIINLRQLRLRRRSSIER